MSWTSDDIGVQRIKLNPRADGPAMAERAPEDEYKHLRNLLFDVLRRFPEAHAAVVRALEESVEAERAGRRNGDGGG